ncbi:MAG: hypothetical protein QOE66_2935 [Chloroflexota bacterium]|nr:hypothetical protein [Chloroflexota bacterium]
MKRGRRRRDLDRREFLRGVGLGVGAATLTSALGGSAAGFAAGGRPKVAAVVTECRYRDHAHVILENFLEPYLFNGKRTDPGFEVAGLYVDQPGDGDMVRDVARQYSIAVYPTIAEALCLGGERLAVDAVLSIGEHGNYPVNLKGQREYPRKRFFDAIVAVFERSGRVVPVFNDKHLSYRWDWARQMYETAERLKIPLMAGSSVPLAERRPALELPEEAEVQAAVSIHGGPLESYDFHGLEVLQSMVESRRGGETGVEAVQFLAGEALWDAAEAGLWSTRLADAAIAAELGADAGRPTLRRLVQAAPFDLEPPHGILLTYRDGFRAIVLKVGKSGTRWNFACQLAGEDDPRATSFYTGPWNNRCLFKALAHAIQVHFRERQAPYPVERTLLTTGILDAAMESRSQGGKTLDTPQLAIAYRPRDFREVREMGSTWRILTPDTPQPPGIDTSGRRP